MGFQIVLFSYIQTQPWAFRSNFFYAEGTPTRLWCADSAVEKNFGGDEAGTLCGGESVEREFVAANCETYAVFFGFGRSDGTFFLTIRYLFVWWDV